MTGSSPPLEEQEHDHGVPFPGAPVPAEQRTDGRVKLEFGRPLDWAALFGRGDARRVVDLGCGNGRYLLAAALARADTDHLGVDLVPEAIQHAARRAGERGLANLKFAWGDALRVLLEQVEPGSVDEVHVYHPQPYYEAGQERRRMLHPRFFGRVCEVLRPDGLLVLQTDNPAYWRYVQSVAPRFFRWQALEGTWPDAPAGRTRREIKARQRGLTIWRGQGTPKPLSPERLASLVRHAPRPAFDANRARFRGKRRKRG